MGIFVALITFLGYTYGQVSGYGNAGMVFALVFSGLTTVGSYYFSDSIVLAISGAKEEPEDTPLENIVENLCIGAGIPKPRIYRIEDTAPNAFATGRDPKHAVICITSGLLDKLDKLELEGVVAHELSHIKNFDSRLMVIVAVLVGTITLLADWMTRSFFFGGRRSREERNQISTIILLIGILLTALSPLIATLIKLAISRRREYLADASAALLTRYPAGLASALEKIAKDREPLEAANKATAHLYIVNPLKNQKVVSWFSSLFNTHPPVEERVERLREM